MGGLFVDSELALANLTPLPMLADKRADVVIRLRDDPDLGGDWQSDFRSLTPDRVGHCIEPMPGLRYRVKNGNEIQIYRTEHFTDFDVNVYLAGTVWGVIFHQRGLLPIHCSAVLHEGRGTCFAGPSGVGKSTLALGLSRRGHRHFSDDLVVVEDSTNGPLMYATTTSIKADDNTLKYFDLRRGKSANSQFYAPKYHVAANNAGVDKPAVIDAIYLLAYGEDCSKPGIEAVRGNAAWSELYRNVFRINMSPWINSRRHVAMQLAGLAGVVPVFRFTRPESFDRYAEALDLLERHIESLSARTSRQPGRSHRARQEPAARQ